MTIISEGAKLAIWELLRRSRNTLRRYVILAQRVLSRPLLLEELLSEIDCSVWHGRTLSFDVFDTSITRVWFEPADLFLVVAAKLQEASLFAGPAHSWERVRQEAERDLRHSLRREVQLLVIYERLATRLGWSTAESARAMQIEQQAEILASRPIAQTARAIGCLQRRGIEVVFISDTYMTKSFVINLLRKCDISTQTASVFVSSESGDTKANAKLYANVLAARGLQPAQLLHVGDNLYSDIACARRIGASVCHFDGQAPNRYERAYYKKSAPRLLRSAVAGASRSARLSKWYPNTILQTLHEIGTNVTGPTLTAYVLWVLLEAKKNGIERLYFLSRDGQILTMIAIQLSKTYSLDLDCRYLFGSRLAFALPAISTLADVPPLMNDDYFGRSLRAILSRVEMEPESHSGILQAAGFAESDWDRPLGSQDLPSLQIIGASHSFAEAVCNRAALRRSLLVDYLRQAGLLDGVASGLVDLGWRGRLQYWLTAAVRGGGSNPDFSIVGFYYGLRERLGSQLVGEQLVYCRAPYPAGELLETFCSADHASVARFQRCEDGSIQPVFAGTPMTEEDKLKVRVLQEAVMTFVCNLTYTVKEAGVGASQAIGYLRDTSTVALNLFEHYPSPAEAEAFGTLSFSGDHVHADPHLMSPRINRCKIFTFAVVAYGKRLRATQWIEGSITRSVRPFERIIFLFIWGARRWLLRLFKRYFIAVRGRPGAQP
jgi:FMN phosphatase YigB (HAD superfamily)